MDQFRTCRTEQLGGHILRCPECGTQVVEYNSCNLRGCPRCAPDRQAQWRIRMLDRALPLAHFHLVFGGPQYLVDLWLAHPRLVISTLFASAAAALAHLMATAELTFGATMVFHSHGKGLSFKPHLHCLLTAGGIDSQRTWHDYHLLAEDQLRTQFRTHMHRRLAASLASAVPDHFAADREKDWRVYVTFHRHSPAHLITYFSRSLFGGLIDTRFHQTCDEHSVQLTEMHGDSRLTTTLDRSVFLHRYLAHIPPAHSVTVRHYGLYSTRYARCRAQLRSALQTPESAESTAEQEHADVPLLLPCPRCHTPMHIQFRFTAQQLPTILRLYREARGSPCAHQAPVSLSNTRASA